MSKERQHYDFKGLGQAIKSARLVAGMTREQLGGKLNLAPVFVLITVYFLIKKHQS